MRIGFIGAGNIGGTLARHLTRLGHQVSIANSRGPESLTALAAAELLSGVNDPKPIPDGACKAIHDYCQRRYSEAGVM